MLKLQKILDQLKVEDPRSVALMVRPRMKEGKPPQRLWREASYDPKPGRLIMFHLG
jgi:hypothetical protein